MVNKLVDYPRGADALLMAKQPMSKKTLGETPRPEALQIKVGSNTKATAERLAKAHGVSVSIMVRWLIHRFDAEHNES